MVAFESLRIASNRFESLRIASNRQGSAAILLRRSPARFERRGGNSARSSRSRRSVERQALDQTRRGDGRIFRRELGLCGAELSRNRRFAILLESHNERICFFWRVTYLLHCEALSPASLASTGRRSCVRLVHVRCPAIHSCPTGSRRFSPSGPAFRQRRRLHDHTLRTHLC